MVTKQNMSSVLKKLNLAWVKWKHETTPVQEKDALEGLIKKMLEKYQLEMDWKTGQVKETGSKQETNKKQEKQEPKKKTAKKGMSTGDLIKFIFETYQDEWTGKNLRRKIRQMEKWNDGKMTHYDFTEEDVKEILTHLGYKVS